MWLRLRTDEPEARLLLRRGQWHREVVFSGEVLVSAHWFEPSIPMRITAKESTRWSVGVGRRSGAESIDQNWVPAAVDVAERSLSEIEDAIFNAIDRRDEAEDDDDPRES